MHPVANPDEERPVGVPTPSVGTSKPSGRGDHEGEDKV